MKVFLKIILVELLLLFAGISMAQDKGYNIEITVEGLQDTTFMLAYYYSESTYTKGTARSDSNGTVVFSGEERLPGGVYILVLDATKTKLFDFAVYRDQHFALKTDTSDFYRNMKVEGDRDNELFFSNLIYNADQNLLAEPHTAVINDENSSEEEKEAAVAIVTSINEKVIEFQEELIRNEEGSLVAKILSARKEIEFPEELIGDEEELREKRYSYYRDHFWDGMDVSDDALIRLPFPLIQQKLDEYFDKVLVQDPDTIIRHIDILAEKARSNEETFKFYVWALTSKYYAPPVMGLDAVFVHLSDTYFESGEMDFWANQQLKDNVLDRASKLRLSMVGMEAPNLIMQDPETNARSMKDISNKYTVLYFYDPDCGHCKVETPKLVDFVNNTGFDVQVYAVCADTSLVKMKNYIRDMGMQNWVNVNGPRSYVGSYQELYDAFQTPTLYLLDRSKKIIAKKLPADRLEEFLGRYEERASGKLED